MISLLCLPSRFGSHPCSGHEEHELEESHECAPTTVLKALHYTQFSTMTILPSSPPVILEHTNFFIIKRQNTDPFAIPSVTGVGGVITVLESPVSTGLAIDTGIGSIIHKSSPPLAPGFTPTLVGSTPTYSDPQTEPSESRPTAHPIALGVPIGGALGGLFVLIIILGAGIWYFRHRKDRLVDRHPKSFVSNSKGTGESSSFKVARYFKTVINSLRARSFVHQYRQSMPNSITAEPWPYDPNHRPPGDKKQRLRRAQREIENVQRLREDMQLDLESLNSESSGNTDDPGGAVERLTERIREMSINIAALQAEIQRLNEEQLPPDYSSMV